MAEVIELVGETQQLRELDRLKDEFLATVSHELRTPLTSIRAFTEILRDNPDLPAAERARYLEIMAAETERLTRMVNQVLDLARLESGCSPTTGSRSMSPALIRGRWSRPTGTASCRCC